MPKHSLTARPEMMTNLATLSLARLLAMPSLILYQTVRAELAWNPALEEVESTETCPRCGGAVLAGDCRACRGGSDVADTAGFSDTAVLSVASPQHPTDTLLSDLRASLPASEHHIAEVLIGNLDERGLLTVTPATIAGAMGIAPAHVAAVLALVQQLGPPGIATASVRECLLAQIDALAGEGVSCPHARTIVAEHLADLGQHRHHAIARQLRITVADVEQARRFIAHNLRPSGVATACPDGWTAPDVRVYRVPDLAIRRSGELFDVEVLQSATRWLRLNPLYVDLARGDPRLTHHERDHVQEQIARARLFIRNLQQRDRTLLRVATSLVARQDAFLRHGPTSLRPLTRIQIAEELGLHHSTVSRAVLDKVALLPAGTLWPLADFFGSSRSAIEELRRVLAEEREERSDEMLTEILAERGFKVARRTVTKYREQLGVPSLRVAGRQR